MQHTMIFPHLFLRFLVASAVTPTCVEIVLQRGSQEKGRESMQGDLLIFFPKRKKNLSSFALEPGSRAALKFQHNTH